MAIFDINTAPIVKRYRFLATLTVGAVIFLILVGGLVRMTGSGMGCPDWPTCFGQWIPPTHIDQLPADYKTQFKVAGKEIADFEAYKTWIEYINRLVGVLIGFFALLTGLTSIGLRKQLPRVTFWSLLGLFMVIIQGGIGAYVVRTNLHTGIISLHMMIALAILAMFLMAWLYARQPGWKLDLAESLIPIRLSWLGLGVLILVIAQIFMGTQVREAVDEIAKATDNTGREGWIEMLTGIYAVHKYFYYLVTAAVLGWLYTLRSYLSNPMVKGLGITMVGSLLLEIALGLGMHHLGLPAWMQPLHLLGATMLFAAAFALLIVCRLQAASTDTELTIRSELEPSGVTK